MFDMFVTCVASPINATPVIRPKPAVTMRHPGGGERAEGDQQDDQSGDHADRGRRADAESLRLLDHLPARRDLQAGDVHRLHLGEQRLAGVGREQVRALVVVDGRERRHSIGRDLHRSSRPVRADDPGDVRQRADACEQWLDRAAHGRRVDRAVRDVEDDRVGVAALRLELALQQVARPLRLGAGQAEHGDVVRPNRLREHRRQDRDGDPHEHDRPRWVMHQRATRLIRSASSFQNAQPRGRPWRRSATLLLSRG